MKIGGQDFSEEIRSRIQRVLDDNPKMSITMISRLVCLWLNWKSVNGRLKEMSCRVALRRLEKKGYLRLPAGRGKNGSGTRWTGGGIPAAAPSVECDLREVGEV